MLDGVRPTKSMLELSDLGLVTFLEHWASDDFHCG